MGSLTYLSLLAGCVLITLPLEVVFRARVWRRPRRLLRAVGPVFVVFYLWDAAVIARGHWWFDPASVTGITLPLGVPLEEALFFLIIPVCALLSLESVRNLLEGHWLGADLLARRRAAAGRPPAGDATVGDPPAVGRGVDAEEVRV